MWILFYSFLRATLNCSMKCLHGCIKHLKQTQDVNQNNRRTVNHGIYVAGIQTCSAFFISLTSSTMIPTTRVSQHKLSSSIIGVLDCGKGEGRHHHHCAR
ncbi:unnamed protein product [Urochloa humidicola]